MLEIPGREKKQNLWLWHLLTHFASSPDPTQLLHITAQKFQKLLMGDLQDGAKDFVLVGFDGGSLYMMVYDGFKCLYVVCSLFVQTPLLSRHISFGFHQAGKLRVQEYKRRT